MKKNEHNCGFYREEDRRIEPKEAFKLLYNDIKQLSTITSICDVGCATGDFLWYINSEFTASGKEVKYTGVDNFQELLDIAKERMPFVEFYKGDIVSMENIPADRKWDVVCMSGVLCMLDDFKTPLNNLISMTKAGGSVYIYSNFNNYGCHVETLYSYVDEKSGEKVDGKIVTFSIKEVAEFLDGLCLKYEFIPLIMNKEIPKNHVEPVRTWTIPLVDGTYGIVNGFNLYQEFFVLKINL